MTTDSASHGGAGGRLRALAANFELAFVVGILAITIVINLLIPQKLSFLNFYFLPIILAGYLLDQRKAMLGGLFCVLLVGVFPLGSRIVAVADAYDAVTSWRPYRDAWERRAALEEIARSVERGLYDPKIVDRLVQLME